MDPIIRPKENCEKCEYYAMIDSGYGYCRRYPPSQLTKVIDKYRKRFFIFSYYVYEFQYPIVAWCNFICAEFIKREKEPRIEGAGN